MKRSRVELVNLAIEVLESPVNALRWLSSPQLGLNNQVPLEIMHTNEGFDSVQTLLNQIEHSVLP